jgi:transposase
LSVVVHAADVQDRDSAAAVLRQARRSFPFIERIYADGGYQWPIMAKTVGKTGPWRLEIVKRCDLHRFVVLPKRWIVERTFAWISHCRRLAKLRASRAQSRCFHPPRHDPHHAPAHLDKPFSLNPNFPERL